MKAIIDGKRYDTEKATKIGGASSNAGRSDFSWWKEDLYKTPRSGAFFLAGEGHARSHYAQNLGGGSWVSYWKITPLTKAEAREWAERHLLVDVLEERHLLVDVLEERHLLVDVLEEHFADAIQDA